MVLSAVGRAQPDSALTIYSSRHLLDLLIHQIGSNVTGLQFSSLHVTAAYVRIPRLPPPPPSPRLAVVIVVTKKRTQHLHNLPTIRIALIPFRHSVVNLPFTLRCHLAMNEHIYTIAQTCYFELHRPASIRRFLTSTATATPISAFVLSRTDLCNSLLFGSTHDVTSHLPRIQNYAARVILRLPKSSIMTTHL